MTNRTTAIDMVYKAEGDGARIGATWGLVVESEGELLEATLDGEAGRHDEAAF